MSVVTIATVCQFWRLPRELRDRIYEYAYGVGSHCRVRINSHELVNLSKTSDRVVFASADALHPVPNVLCNNLHVNWKFFNEAVPAMIPLATFHFAHPQHFNFVMEKYPMVRAMATAVVITFTSREEEAFPFPCYFDRSITSSTVNACPKLREVTTKFDGDGLSQSACLQDDNFIGDRIFSRVVEDLKNMRGVDTFNLKFIPELQESMTNDIWGPPDPTYQEEARINEWVAVEEDIAKCASKARESNA